MSYEIVAKVSYNKVDETITIFSCSNNVWPKTYTDGHTVTLDNINSYYTRNDLPEYVKTSHEKIMFWLYSGIMDGNFSLNSTVSVKYRNANTIVEYALLQNGGLENWNKQEFFELFLDAVDGKVKLTKGSFILINDDTYTDTLYYKNASKGTFAKSRAKVFKSVEEASLVGKSKGFEVVELVA